MNLRAFQLNRNDWFRNLASLHSLLLPPASLGRGTLVLRNFAICAPVSSFDFCVGVGPCFSGISFGRSLFLSFSFIFRALLTNFKPTNLKMAEPFGRTSAGMVMREYFQPNLMGFPELLEKISAWPYDHNRKIPLPEDWPAGWLRTSIL